MKRIQSNEKIIDMFLYFRICEGNRSAQGYLFLYWFKDVSAVSWSEWNIDLKFFCLLLLLFTLDKTKTKISLLVTLLPQKNSISHYLPSNERDNEALKTKQILIRFKDLCIWFLLKIYQKIVFTNLGLSKEITWDLLDFSNPRWSWAANQQSLI